MVDTPVGKSNQATVLGGLAPRQVPRAAPDIGPENRTTCRWCLNVFDPSKQQPRTIWERGQLRTHLKMSDNGSELVICDNCWPAASGYVTTINGRMSHNAKDPEAITNPLLRELVKNG